MFLMPIVLNDRFLCLIESTLLFHLPNLAAGSVTWKICGAMRSWHVVESISFRRSSKILGAKYLKLRVFGARLVEVFEWKAFATWQVLILDDLGCLPSRIWRGSRFFIVFVGLLKLAGNVIPWHVDLTQKVANIWNRDLNMRHLKKVTPC